MIENPLCHESFLDLLHHIIGQVVIFSAPIFVLMIVYAGFLYTTSRGNEESLKTAKKVILYALIGYLIIVMSWVLLSIVGGFLGAKDSEDSYENADRVVRQGC